MRNYPFSLLLLFTLFLGPELWAQPAQPLRLTLGEAMALGLQNRPELRNQQIAVQIAENTIQKNRGQWLPDVNGSANLRFNTQLPTTVLPADFLPGGAGVPQRIRFGTRFNHVLGLDATQPLYNPRLRQEVRIAEKNRELEQEVLRQTEADLKLTIAETYYEALLRQEEVELAQRAVERAERQVTLAKARLELGTLLESDYNRIRLDYLNAEVKERRSQQQLQLSLQQLANALYLNPAQPLLLTDSLSAPLAPEPVTADSDGQVENRSEFRQSRLNAELSQLNYERAALGLRPTLDAYANYSAQYQSDRLNLLNDQAWSPFNYLGLQLAVPIFDRQATRYERAEYRLRQEQARNDLNQQSRNLLNELQTARTELLNAQLNLRYARENYDLAREVYQVSLSQYELGALLYNELLNTEKSLNEAEVNLLSSLYDLLVAKVRWMRARGAL